MFHVKHSILHTEVSKSTLEKVNKLLSKNDRALTKYSDHLLWWNKKVNLVSRGVSRETVLEHIKHSLLLHEFISEGGYQRIIDTGTGGGLPGIPLAICFPETEFLLNDIVAKKIMAVKQMISSLSLKNIIPNSGSIESVNVSTGNLIITKHAFKINQLIGYLNDKDWSKIIFLKGEEEAENELSGISRGLNIKITNLDKVIKSDFYRGKAIIEVERIDE